MESFVRRHRRVRAVCEPLEPRKLLSASPLFADDFNLPVGSQPSNSTWLYRNGTDPNNGNVHYTNTPSTLQVIDDPAATDGRALAMTIAPDPSNPGRFLSSEIQTSIDPVAGHLQYGHIEARIKLPGGPNGQGDGVWPAFWMLGSDFPQVGWPASGEIDIMENKGSRPGEVQATIHGPGYSGGSGVTAPYDLPGGQSFYSGYHVFAADWAPDSIRFSVDGHVYATRTPASLPAGTSWNFNHPFYLILDLCEGGAFGGPAGPNSVFPQTMLVDYVHVASTADPFLAASGTSIRAGAGSGDVIHLRGVNLGGWLVDEPWMDPIDSSGLVDDLSVRQTLDARFGIATRNQILSSYETNWITPKDLGNIQAMGMNVIRVPFWWRNLEEADGTLRPDAFTTLDWVVDQAWQRGIYTVLDLHGVVGSQNGAVHSGQSQSGGGQFWSSAADQSQTAALWSQIGAHYRTNPAVAGYDLMNEPYGAPNLPAMWSAYSLLYSAVRGADPDHIVFMEGTWSGTYNGTFVNWDWNALPNPATYNWNNVVYEMHAYAGGTNGAAPTLAQEEGEVNKQVNGFVNHQTYNVPVFIGEFNNHALSAAWNYAIQQYDQHGMSWATWAYKATNGTVGNSWGLYDPVAQPPRPNLKTDSLTTILNDYAQLSVPGRFAITPMLKYAMAMPVPVDDSYAMGQGQTLSIGQPFGVLANDTDLNLGQPGILLVPHLLSAPAHGQLNLASDGSFTYTPNGGFLGADTFRYLLTDGRADSTRAATVTIRVNLNGDVNGDGKVDFSDLVILAAHYGQPGIFSTGDLNLDGSVDFADLVLLASNFGRSVAPVTAVRSYHPS